MASHLEQEIAEQPQALRALLETQTGTARQIAAAIREFDPVFVLIAARGTSDNAGRYAQYLMGIQAGLPVALAAPSIHTLYEAPPKLSRALVIGISQSGQAEDVRRVISDAQGQGALTISITNDAESPLAHAAAYHLPLSVGKEISVAATKTYTAQLTAVALLVASLKNNTEMNDGLADLPDYITQTLHLSEAIPGWVQRYRYMERFAVIGRGYNYSTAFEISLKIKELCNLPGVEYSEADFRHGPIAMIQPGFPIFVVAPTGKTLPGERDLLKLLRERRAECLVISDAAELREYAQNMMLIPAMPEWLSPIASVIPGQIFAMHLSAEKGYTVDAPTGLTKVTITA